MTKYHRIAVVAVALLISACDGTLRIRGEAPEAIPCVVRLIDGKTGEIANEMAVSGIFEKSVLFAGHWRAPEMTVTAECEGKTVLVVENPKFPELDLGNLQI